MRNLTKEEIQFIYNLLIEELEQIDKNIGNKYVDRAYLDERMEIVKKILEKFD